jgi:hypothetical protein
VVKQGPDLVYTVGTAARPDNPQDEVVSGLGDAAQVFDQHGIKVVAVRDNPRFDRNMVECIESDGIDAATCNRSRSASLNDAPPVDELLAEGPNIKFIDMTDNICTTRTCPAVVGNILVYLDDNHLTRTYLETMMPVFTEQFDAATPF